MIGELFGWRQARTEYPGHVALVRNADQSISLQVNPGGEDGRPHSIELDKDALLALAHTVADMYRPVQIDTTVYVCSMCGLINEDGTHQHAQCPVYLREGNARVHHG